MSADNSEPVEHGLRPGAEFDVFLAVVENYSLWERQPYIRKARNMCDELLIHYTEWFKISRDTRCKILMHYVNSPVKSNERIPLIGTQSNFSTKYFPKDSRRDVKALRAAFRAAALILHPDLGGSNERMIRLIETFESLHKSILDLESDRPAESRSDDRPSVFRPDCYPSYAATAHKDQDRTKFREFYNAPTTRDASLLWHYIGILVDDWNLDGAVNVISLHSYIVTFYEHESNWGWGTVYNDPGEIVDKIIRRSMAIRRRDILHPLLLILPNISIPNRKFLVNLTHPRQLVNVRRLRDAVP